ncbi:MAG: fused MFS/spermidine synthase [Chloroflexi bacterium]|nr:fused MFS/spermidine synthase [Chloroflexota bacterium]
MKRYFLMLMVFLGGVSSMGIEMAASRLLRPFFGDSILIWANIIGLILIYLTIGYYLGGRWADRDPRPVTLYRAIAWAGFATGLLPYIARHFLQLAISALAQFDAGLGLTSFAGTLVLFFIPVTLLGCVSPFAIRLTTRDVSSSGATAGTLYALSTAGSIVGVFGTVFVLFAILGTRGTFLAFSILLLAGAIAGILLEAGKLPATRYSALLLVIAIVAALDSGGVVKAAPGLIYETESPYNYIQVIAEGDLRLLTVNEGQAYQSAYRASGGLSGGIWDLFLIAPFFASNTPPRSVLMIGLAAGTVAHEYTQVYGAIPIDGVELDPRIIAVGRQYFAMTMPNLNAIADDGRNFLQTRAGQYDVIAVDAYRQPYIPFHLTTVEFFTAVREHLTPNGVVALNAARTANDYRLVDALAATMRRVFPSVYLIDHPNNANTLLVATRQPTRGDDFRAIVAALRDPMLRTVAAQSLPTVRAATQTEPIFTDDHAPVESLINDIILRYAMGAP